MIFSGYEINEYINVMEIWKDVKGYEGLYQVSNLGNVKSLDRYVNGNWGDIKLRKGKMLSKHINNSGYYTVTLSSNGKQNLFLVHQLMAISFLNHTPNGKKIVVDHIDNDKKNNHLSNLQVITARKNLSKDTRKTSSVFTGVFKKGKKWQSAIRIGDNLKYLGTFKCELAAAYAYNKALKDLHN